MMSKFFTQKGSIHILPLLVIVAVVGVISYLLVSSVAPFQGGLFGNINPKPKSEAATTQITAYSSRIPWQGGSYFAAGANVPWYNWSTDFGGGPSGGGVSGNTAALQAGFQQLKNAGVHTVRWWVFEGDPWQINRDASGPTTLNTAVYQDFDAAIQLANQYDLYYDFVLFSDTTSMPHSWETDPAQRQKLVTALTPLFQRYSGNSRVMTWELYNEPEWQTRNGLIDTQSVVETGRALTTAIHSNSTSYVTVGNAQLQDMPTWFGTGLDYYSPHFYDNFDSSNNPVTRTAAQVRAQWNVDRPIVIGEIPMDSGASGGALNRWNALYNGGYAGGWVWSLFSDHTGDKLSVDFPSLTTFASAHSDLGPKNGGASTPPPTITPTNIPTPTVRPTSTPTLRPTPTPTVMPSPTPTPVTQSLPGTPVVKVPSCIAPGYSGTGVTISWAASNPASGWLDISSNGFISFYNKNISGSLTTTAPSGFRDYPAEANNLTLNPNTTYSVRLYNAYPGTDGHGFATTFTIPQCATPTPIPTSTPSPRPTATPVQQGSVINIIAAGQAASGNPSMTLTINGTDVATWSVGGNATNGSFQTFTYNSPSKVTHDRVRVRFTNDFYNPSTGADRNLRVDQINIDSVTFQSEAAGVTGLGVWTGNSCNIAGKYRSEWLVCNGYFQY